MTELDEKVLGGVTAMLIVLVVGAVFGRLHGSDGAAVKAVGDRVACGLLAMPLISLAVHLAFPSARPAWILSAPLPLAVYVVLLAGTDIGWTFARKHFTSTLVAASLAIYAAMAVCMLLFHA
jgi:ABC-type dipeptide/oligopeptide/nickel transport system permease subunit